MEFNFYPQEDPQIHPGNGVVGSVPSYDYSVESLKFPTGSNIFGTSVEPSPGIDWDECNQLMQGPKQAGLDEFIIPSNVSDTSTTSPQSSGSPVTIIGSGTSALQAGNNYIKTEPNANFYYGQQGLSQNSQLNFDLNNQPISSNHSNSSDNGAGSVDLDENSEEIMVKRKAQNRAAQRAFRERKEQKVRELERKLNDSEKEKKRLASENAQLRQQNTVIQTENQVLMATTKSTGDVVGSSNGIKGEREMFSVHRFNNLLLEDVVPEDHGKDIPEVSYIKYEKPEGEVMLGAGAVWQRIMDEPESDEIDVEEVMKYLKGKEHCDGFGPVFSLADVKKGILIARRK